MGQTNSNSYDSEEEVTKVSPSQAQRLNADIFCRNPTFDYVRKNVPTENTRNTKLSWEKEMAAALPEIHNKNKFDEIYYPRRGYTLKTAAVEKKENTTSSTRSFTTIVHSRNTTTLTSGNVLLTQSKKTMPTLHRENTFIRNRNKKRGQIISYIIQNLCLYTKYKEQKSEYEDQESYGPEYYNLKPYYLKPYSMKSLKDCLKMSPEELYDNFEESCK
ncbi:8320_t:CDS:2, partial [Racocetra fulgida]